MYFNHIIKHKYISFLSILIKWVLWGGVIGIAVGTTSSVLLNTNDFLTSFRADNLWIIYFLPVGGLVIGYLYQHYGKGSGKGNNLILEHVQHGQGRIPLGMGPLVFISTFITMLLGGSTGREGAAIQMGTSIAEAVNRIFKVNVVDRKILIISGIAGGFGSAFGAPLTGTIFAMEIIAIGRMQYQALVPCFVASFVGHFVTTAWGVNHEHHIIELVPQITTMNILKIIAVSIIFSFASILYTQMKHGVENMSRKYLESPMTRAFIGGLIIIALTLVLGTNDYLGRGLPIVDEAFKGTVSPFAWLNKAIFTAITMGTGFRGGEVIPLFFIGSTLGNTLAPLMNLPTSFLAGLGMIAVFCAATNAPIAALIFSVETFEGEGVFFFFIACIVSYIFSGHHGIYGAQKILEPKSRMLNLSAEERIAAIEKKK